MNLTNDTKGKIVFLSIFFISLIYFGYKSFRDDYIIKHYGAYTIGQINEIKGTNGGVVVYYSFIYSNDTITTAGRYSDFSKRISHKRYYVQFLRKNLKRCRILLDDPVPDSIKDAPPYGWNKLPNE